MNSMKILIVEDDNLARTLLTTLLSEYGRCQIATNGQQALDMIEQAVSSGEYYSLILLDIMMPVLNGQETLIRLREIEDENGLKQEDKAKVLMVTAVDDKENIMRAFKDGKCEAYLTKPVDYEKLLNHLKQLELV